MIRGSSRISVGPRQFPLHPRECPWILANVRGHPRGSFWNPRGCAKCPISDHQSARECAKSIREAVFDIRESSGDIPEGPNGLREDAKLIREDATDVRECPRILADVHGCSGMSGNIRECLGILANVWGSSRMYVMEVNRGASTSWRRLPRRRRVGDLECAIDDGERLAELLFGDAQRGVREEIVPVDECVHPLIAQVGAETLHLGAGAVEGSHGLLRLAIAYQLEDTE